MNDHLTEVSVLETTIGNAEDDSRSPAWADVIKKQRKSELHGQITSYQ
jgi:hypothetical protein